METEQFEAKLKPNLDLTKFSHLLETDHGENRTTSSTALYGSIERPDKTVVDMK